MLTSDVQISKETLETILENSSDEIFVLDKNLRVVYVNKHCQYHYGLTQADVLGRKNSEFVERGLWKPSVVPLVLKEKKPVTIKQVTYIGSELLTTAVPILNENQEIILIVITAHELENYKILKQKQKVQPTIVEEIDHKIITNSNRLNEVIKLAEKVAHVDSTVLIRGESGTGKGLFANFIHQKSDRKNQPLLTLNCAAIPDNLIESELFGYAQGAFTGASRGGKKGLLEAANNGTVFLDEIGEISSKIQAKLLQVIQDKEFIPVGGDKVKKVNVRIIAATNQNLEELVKQKIFRDDLYYRLNVIELNIPPLRERPEDIIPLCYYFLRFFNEKYQKTIKITKESLNLFFNYSWPGNVRQLENVIERLVVITDSYIGLQDIPELISTNTPIDVPIFTSLNEALENTEKRIVLAAYETYKSSRKVAKALNISQTKASTLIRKYRNFFKNTSQN
ncbi:sigma 54-interacting transcriptional regulator [Neobacillus cucumis]|uniref:sigma-54 interaction domain-containing protein n=1 Tax=Neobacillus cucumis TaxID=1740721 RepID=UPI0018E0606E|nr:sigma 54-interacting transcriptional regulator [Neobacillus cucumis]MBI0577392.1 sigma 54-interacting transcriptional regulator [Neobacillus cucumis]